MVRRRRRRPYRKIGLALLIPGALLILASIPQFFFGIPVSEGVAPAGLSLGPLLVIGGTVLYFSEKPQPGERWTDDSSTFRWLDVGQWPGATLRSRRASRSTAGGTRRVRS